MDTTVREPEYIAQQVKLLRKMYGLTQENLAEAAGISTRTVEKVESGRHRPNEQTLRSIARAIQMDNTSFFNKPSPEKEATTHANMERATRKIAITHTVPIRKPADFLRIFGYFQASQVDISQVEGDEALDLSASLTDWIRDLIDIWVDLTRSDQLRYARSIIEICDQLEELGYTCYMGSYRMQNVVKNRPSLEFQVGVVTLLPRDDKDGERVALIELEGSWETLESDRFPIPLNG